MVTLKQLVTFNRLHLCHKNIGSVMATKAHSTVDKFILVVLYNTQISRLFQLHGLLVYKADIASHVCSIRRFNGMSLRSIFDSPSLAGTCRRQDQEGGGGGNSSALAN